MATAEDPGEFAAGVAVEASGQNNRFDPLYVVINALGDDNIAAGALSADRISGTAATLTGGSEQTVVRDTLFTGKVTLSDALVLTPASLGTGATPSVGGAIFFTVGTADTITDFTGGTDGQTIILMGAHSSGTLTISDNANIDVDGSGNVVMAQGETMAFIRADPTGGGALWVEIFRSF